MQQAEVHPQCLRRQVEAECHQYAAAYEPPENGETLGAPRSKEEVSANIEDMASLVVAPISRRVRLKRRFAGGLRSPLNIDFRDCHEAISLVENITRYRSRHGHAPLTRHAAHQ